MKELKEIYSEVWFWGGSLFIILPAALGLIVSATNDGHFRIGQFIVSCVVYFVVAPFVIMWLNMRSKKSKS